MVTTHLVQFFLGGAGGSGQQVTQPLIGGVRQSHRWNTDSLDLSKWAKNKRKLEAKIESVQKRIDKKREKIDNTLDFQKIEVLKKQLAELQKLLLSLVGAMDDLRKMQDEEEAVEAVAAYIAYRTLH